MGKKGIKGLFFMCPATKAIRVVALGLAAVHTGSTYGWTARERERKKVFIGREQKKCWKKRRPKKNSLEKKVYL